MVEIAIETYIEEKRQNIGLRYGEISRSPVVM